MIIESVKDLAMSFPNVTAAPHFDRTAFKLKRIFCTLHEPSRSVNIKLLPEVQVAFCALDTKHIYPVNNKWGLQGWTTLELQGIDLEILKACLEAGYENAG